MNANGREYPVTLDECAFRRNEWPQSSEYADECAWAIPQRIERIRFREFPCPSVVDKNGSTTEFHGKYSPWISSSKSMYTILLRGH